MQQQELVTDSVSNNTRVTKTVKDKIASLNGSGHLLSPWRLLCGKQQAITSVTARIHPRLDHISFMRKKRQFLVAKNTQHDLQPNIQCCSGSAQFSTLPDPSISKNAALLSLNLGYSANLKRQKKLFPPFFSTSICVVNFAHAVRNSWCKLRPCSGHLNVQLTCACTHPSDRAKFILDLHMHLCCQHNRNEHDNETSPGQEDLNQPAFHSVWERCQFLSLTSRNCARPIPISVTITLTPNLVTFCCDLTWPRRKAPVVTSLCTRTAGVLAWKGLTRTAQQLEGTYHKNAHGLEVRHHC